MIRLIDISSTNIYSIINTIHVDINVNNVTTNVNVHVTNRTSPTRPTRRSASRRPCDDDHKDNIINTSLAIR